MSWVLKTDENHYWDKESHSWVVGIEHATQYTDEEKNQNQYPKIVSHWGSIVWEEIK